MRRGVRTQHRHDADDDRRIPWSSIRRALAVEQERALELDRLRRRTPAAPVNPLDVLDALDALDDHLASATATAVDRQIVIGFVEQLQQGGGIPVSVGG